MPMTALKFKPGIVSDITSYSNEGGFVDGDKVRFRFGFPEKFGGWEKYSPNQYLGSARRLHNWVALDGSDFMGVGTHLKYYIEEGGTFNDVTPIRSSTTNSTTFSATNGSANITVTETNHGAAENDFVTFSNAVSLGGNVTATILNAEHQIVSVTNANTYVITVSVTANSSDTGNGGSATDAEYQITVGLDSQVGGTGWGAGTWGAGTWGSSSPLSELNQLRLWSLDSFGEDLIANVRAGRIYYWDTSAKTLGTDRAVDIADLSGANFTPTAALQVLVSDVDRHVIALGADPINDAATARTGTIDPLLIAFSDQENPAEWFPTATNTAGSLRCSAGSQIIGGLRARQETLVWTDVALYSLQFIGAPLTFGLNLINEGVSLIGPNAPINTPAGVYWMDKKGFYSYQGAVQPVPCSVRSYVFDDFNEGQAFQVFAFLNKQFDEVGWFYCSASSSEIDRYVIYNYAEDLWFYGQLVRTAWLDSGIENYPRAVNGGYLFQQEIGFNDDGSPMTGVFIESSDFDLDDGEKFAFARRIIPDFKFIEDANNGSVNVVVKTRNFPGDSLATNSTNEISSTTQQSHIRARARQMALRIESNDDATNNGNLSIGWRLGATRIDIKTDGKR